MRDERMLSPHPHAALEYWFFKVNAGPVAILVDWMARRRLGECWLRVSLHSPQRRKVLFEKQPAFSLVRDHNFLNPQRTAGQLGEVAWDLTIASGQEWIVPDIFPATLLQMMDLALVSAPQATFSGWIRVDGQPYDVQQAPGMLSHYWGRHLAPEWWWISANQFDQSDVAVECSILRSNLWGIPVRLPLAYLYLRHADRRELVMAPFGLARVVGSPEKFEIQIQPLGGEPVTLAGVGRDYGDLGDGIINTLVGDLEIRVGSRVIARATGTAGIERRALVAPPSPALPS